MANREIRENPPLLCYVDESGDMGLNHASPPWFFLSACIVAAKQAPLVDSYIDEAKDAIWVQRGNNPPSELDWKGRSHPQRGALLPIFTSRPYCQIVIGIWKEHLTRPVKLAEGNSSYLYACRYLLERISWYARDSGGFVRITFSKTHRLRLPDLKDYLHKIMGERDCSIEPVFEVEDIRESSMANMPMLTLADNAVSSFAAGFNPDLLGVTYPHHTAPAIHHLYRYNGSVWRYGFKIIPPEVSKGLLVSAYPFTRDWF